MTTAAAEVNLFVLSTGFQYYFSTLLIEHLGLTDVAYAMYQPREGIERRAAAGHPVVYADWLHAAGKPTVLLYGHYDVQPAEPLELWVTPPFEPSLREGKLFGRGASDNKGQNLAHLKAVEAHFKTGTELPCDLTFVIEGEEEVGSKSLVPHSLDHGDEDVPHSFDILRPA